MSLYTSVLAVLVATPNGGSKLAKAYLIQDSKCCPFSAHRLAYRAAAVLELQGRHFQCGPTASTVAAILGNDWEQV